MAKSGGNWVRDTLSGLRLFVIMGLASIVVVPVLITAIVLLIIF